MRQDSSGLPRARRVGFGGQWRFRVSPAKAY